MKQHITTKQLNELSEKGKEKLKKWWSPRSGNLIARDNRMFPSKDSLFLEEVLIIGGLDDEMDSQYGDEEGIYPLLSMGQMIEFLYDHRPDKRYKDIAMPIADGYKDEIKPEEFCDALFEAVKEILDK